MHGKWRAAERESEGVVVVTTAGTTEPGSSEGPLLHRCTTLAGRGSGECPVRASSVSKAAGLEASRALQRVLYGSAKQDPTRRFHALYQHVAGGDILWRAWADVRANRGAPGVDGLTIEAVEASGVAAFLAEIAAALKKRSYGPAPLRRVRIPKPGRAGETRPLGIPTLRDRVVMTAAKIVLEPIFEADFLPVSFGFRPKRWARQALEAIRVEANRGRLGARRRRFRLLRQHRPRRPDGRGGRTGVRSADAEADRGVAASGGAGGAAGTCSGGPRHGRCCPCAPRSDRSRIGSSSAGRSRRSWPSSTAACAVGPPTSATATRRGSSTRSTATSTSVWRSGPLPSTAATDGTGNTATRRPGWPGSASIASADRCVTRLRMPLGERCRKAGCGRTACPV